MNDLLKATRKTLDKARDKGHLTPSSFDNPRHTCGAVVEQHEGQGANAPELEPLDWDDWYCPRCKKSYADQELKLYRAETET